MTTSPKSLKVTSFWTIRCVPIRTSTVPALVRLRTSLTSDLGRNRLTASTVNGNSAIRAEKLRWCCSARIVVGTSTATCLPASTALNAARMATSVLP